MGIAQNYKHQTMDGILLNMIPQFWAITKYINFIDPLFDFIHPQFGLLELESFFKLSHVILRILLI